MNTGPSDFSGAFNGNDYAQQGSSEGMVDITSGNRLARRRIVPPSSEALDDLMDEDIQSHSGSGAASLKKAFNQQQVMTNTGLDDSFGEIDPSSLAGGIDYESMYNSDIPDMASTNKRDSQVDFDDLDDFTDDTPTIPTRPQKVTKRASFDTDENQDFEDGISLGVSHSNSDDSNASVKRRRSGGTKYSHKVDNEQSVDDSDEYDEDDYDEDDYDDDSSSTKGFSGALDKFKPVIIIVVAIVAVVLLSSFFKSAAGKVNPTAGLQQAQEKPAQEEEQGKQDIPEEQNNPVNKTTVSSGPETILSNQNLNYDDSKVYTDTMCINKFIRVRDGVVSPIFIGYTKYLQKTVEVPVTVDEYNKYVNGVELTINYEITYVNDVMYATNVRLVQDEKPNVQEDK